MDGQMDIRKNGQTKDRQVNRWLDGGMYKQKGGQVDRWMDKQIWKDGWTDE